VTPQLLLRELLGMRVRVCSLASLMEMKRQSSRMLDQVDLEALEAAHAPEDEQPA
jgi:hypothetical protein